MAKIILNLSSKIVLNVAIFGLNASSWP